MVEKKKYDGSERRSRVDNSAIYHKLGVVETKLDDMLGIKKDVESLKTSRTYARGFSAAITGAMGYLGFLK